jgi:outer membrane protein assembly factor BamE (lipoprotein component of BamABCDE complex)
MARQVNISPRTIRQRALRGGVALSLLALGTTAIIAGCSPITIKHGHHFQETDVQQIQPGMSQDAVRLALGTPATTSTVAGGNTYYYISSTETQTAFFKPTEVDRKILAVYFNQVGSVERVAHYGMKDGKIFDFVKRETPSHVRDQGLLKQIFRGIGQKALFD